MIVFSESVFEYIYSLKYFASWYFIVKVSGYQIEMKVILPWSSRQSTPIDSQICDIKIKMIANILETWPRTFKNDYRRQD